ncbi:MAG: hypothetical protein ACMUIG_04025 [Thermoplasmatota archaeon]
MATKISHISRELDMEVDRGSLLNNLGDVLLSGPINQDFTSRKVILLRYPEKRTRRFKSI